MVDSDLEIKTLASENRRLRYRLVNMTILACGLGSAFFLAVIIAAILAELLLSQGNL